MKIRIPDRYRPLVVAIVVAGVAYGAYVAAEIFGEPAVGDCCATDFDPTPYQQIPASR